MASTSGLGSASIPGSSSAVSVTRQEATGLVRQVSRLLNRQLSSICQVNGLKSTGIKAELQKRIGQREFRRATDHFALFFFTTCFPLGSSDNPPTLSCMIFRRIALLPTLESQH
jgi:hypothetical protein